MNIIYQSFGHGRHGRPVLCVEVDGWIWYITDTGCTHPNLAYRAGLRWSELARTYFIVMGGAGEATH